MKKLSKKSITQINKLKNNVIDKTKMKNLKGGSDTIGIQELVDG